MTEQEQKECREAFETWAKLRDFDCRNTKGRYHNCLLQDYWIGWQARGEYEARETAALKHDIEVAQETSCSVLADLHELIRMALTNTCDLQGFIQVNYLEEYAAAHKQQVYAEEYSRPSKAEMVNLTTSDSSTLLEVLRQDGWMVAVHNDYRLNGDLHTFWLFTQGNQCVKGEGRTDKAALVEVFRTLPPQRDDSRLVEELERARDAVQSYNPSLAGAQRIGFNKAIAIVKAAQAKAET